MAFLTAFLIFSFLGRAFFPCASLASAEELEGAGPLASLEDSGSIFCFLASGPSGFSESGLSVSSEAEVGAGAGAGTGAEAARGAGAGAGWEIGSEVVVASGIGAGAGAAGVGVSETGAGAGAGTEV